MAQAKWIVMIGATGRSSLAVHLARTDTDQTTFCGKPLRGWYAQVPGLRPPCRKCSQASFNQ